MTTRVLLIRHGETDWNAEGRWQGHAPVPLNAQGLAQSAALGRYLAGNGLRIGVLYSSDLKRAMQTAEPVAAALHLPIHTDQRLREIDLGNWQGLTRQEALTWDTERYHAYHADRYAVPMPGGESRGDLRQRARLVFDEITARHAGRTVAVVSHGGTLGAMIESVCGPVEHPSISNTSISILEQNEPGGAWTLVQSAWTPHLTDHPLDETW